MIPIDTIFDLISVAVDIGRLIAGDKTAIKDLLIDGGSLLLPYILSAQLKAVKALMKTNPEEASKLLQKFIKIECFTKGTLISTKDGLKPIEEIHVGDAVYSENPETGEKGLKRVKNVFITEASTIVHLFIDNVEIQATFSHPFYVIDRGWVEAGELRIGDKLKIYSGEIVHVQAIYLENLDKPVKVYNFEIDGWHTYFVSDLTLLVHNDCD